MQSQNAKSKIKLKDRAYQYSISVIEFADALPQDISCRIIIRQLIRSATSVGANIV